MQILSLGVTVFTFYLNKTNHEIQFGSILYLFPFWIICH